MDAIVDLLVASDSNLGAGLKIIPSTPDAFTDEGGANLLVKCVELHFGNARLDRHFDSVRGHLQASTDDLAKLHEGGLDAKFERSLGDDSEGGRAYHRATCRTSRRAFG